jgi:hypothetical protein
MKQLMDAWGDCHSHAIGAIKDRKPALLNAPVEKLDGWEAVPSCRLSMLAIRRPRLITKWCIGSEQGTFVDLSG